MAYTRRRTTTRSKPRRRSTRRTTGYRKKKTYKRKRTTVRRRSNFKGRGDYSRGVGFQTNQLIKGSGQRPMTVNGSKDLTGDIYLARREFLGNINASITLASAAPTGGQSAQSAFNIQTFNINAGLSTTFPWLAQVARNFTLYEFEGLIFEYKPLSGENGNLNTNALGKVVLATQYDPDAPNFSSTIQMENYDYATSCKPSEHMLHGVETKVRQRATNMLYIRTGPSSKDEVLTDLADFQIATEGIPLVVPSGALSASVPIGELWVTYKCKLSRANIYNSSLALLPPDVHIGYNVNAAIYGATSSTQLTTVGGLLSTLYQSSGIGSNIFCPKKTNTIGTTVVGLTTSSAAIIFPPGLSGTFLMCVQVTDTVSEAPIFSINTGTSANILTAIANGWQVPSGIPTGVPTAASTTFITAANPTTVDVFTSTKNGIICNASSLNAASKIPTAWTAMNIIATPSQCGVATISNGVATTGTLQFCVIIQPTGMTFTS